MAAFDLPGTGLLGDRIQDSAPGFDLYAPVSRRERAPILQGTSAGSGALRVPRGSRSAALELRPELSLAGPMTMGSGDPDEVVLDALRRAVAQAPRRPAAIEVDIRLSILLGQQRPSVSCGGCSVPLEFEGIPARTNPHLGIPFRLLSESSSPSS